MTDDDFAALDAWALAERLAQRSLRAQDLVRACLDRIGALDGDVQAFIAVGAEAALARARAIDAGTAPAGPLHGLPLGVKDLFDTADLPTGYGSAPYAGHRPAADAASVALCRAAGAIVLGKTVSTEFAYFHPGATRHPQRLPPAAPHTPGGSSSGSAAAVAAGMVPLALGTQTAASIIRPAAFCGVVGYKPSLGRVPRAGVKSLAESLDVVGGFGRSVRDVALLGSVLARDARLRDAVAAPSPAAPRIGLCATLQWAQADADTRAAWAIATEVLGAAAPALALPADLPDLAALHLEVMAGEMALALAAEHLQHRGALSPRLLALLDNGAAMPGVEHAARLAQVAQLRLRIAAWFDASGVDVLLAPSTVGAAPAGLEATGDPLFCRGWTLLGLPSVHLPFATSADGLPVGLQLVGRFGDDHRLLAAAHGLHPRLHAAAR